LRGLLKGLFGDKVELESDYLRLGKGLWKILCWEITGAIIKHIALFKKYTSVI
jgi:hypothetical protein